LIELIKFIKLTELTELNSLNRYHPLTLINHSTNQPNQPHFLPFRIPHSAFPIPNSRGSVFWIKDKSYYSFISNVTRSSL
jgi:hypothetical protein